MIEVQPTLLNMPNEQKMQYCKTYADISRTSETLLKTCKPLKPNFTSFEDL